MDFHINALSQLSPLLRGLRKHAGLTQTEVAEKIGTTQQRYAKIEADPSITDVARLWTILRVLGASMTLHLPDQSAVSVFESQSATDTPGRKEAAVSQVAGQPAKRPRQAKTKSVVAPASVLPPSGNKEEW